MKLQITLRGRLVLLVVVAIFPLFGVTIFEAWLNADSAISRATEQLKSAVGLVAARQERVAASAQHILMAIANAPGLTDRPSADCQRYLTTLNKQLPGYANLGLIGPDGNFRCHGVDNRPLPFVGDRDYFQETLARRRFTVGGYTLGRAIGKPVITFTLPLLGSEGKVSAVAFAAVDLSEISKVVADVPLSPGGQLVITDRQGLVLAVNPENPAMIGQMVPSALLQEAVQTMRTGVAQGPDAQGRQRIYAFMPAGESAYSPFCVAVSVDREGVLAPARKELALELALLALLAFLGGWLAWGMAGRAIVKPTTDILEATGRLQRGRLEARIAINPRDGGGEFSKIADSVNRMADSLQTQREALQAQLAHSQEIQKKLGDAQRLARLGYWQSSLDTGQIMWSDEAYELLGVDRQSFDDSRDSFLALIHPDDRAAYEARRAAAVQAGQPMDIEYRVVKPDGQLRWIHQFGRTDASIGVKQARVRSGVIQDITGRKIAEQALFDSEQRLRRAELASQSGNWELHLDGGIMHASEGAAALYGLTGNAFDFAAIKTVPLPQYRPLLDAAFEKLVTQNAPYNVEFKIRTADTGQIKDIHSLAWFDAENQVLFGTIQDISARKQAEQKLAEHLFTLQRAADAAQAITWHQTLQGALQEVAEQARGVIGAHQAIVSFTQGNDWAHALNVLSLSDKYAPYRELTVPMDGSGIDALVCETNHSMRLTQAELEAHPRWRGFGSHAVTHPPLRGWLAVPLIGRDGKNIGLLQLSDKYEGEFTQPDEYVALELAQLASGAIENARLIEEVGQLNSGLEQKVAKRTAALARQEAIFHALSDQAPQVVWMTKPNGSVTYANHAWFDLVGGTVDDWGGDKWLEVIHPEDLPAVEANWRAASTDLSLFSGVRRLRAKDGSYHTMAYRASPVLDAQGKVLFWVGIDADISELKAIETALRLANHELEAFSYSVSHDLRSPLNTIDGFSQLLAKQIDTSGNDKLRHYLSRIQAGTRQMGQLISDLLALSQVSRAQLRSEPVDLSALARGILADCQLRQPARQVVLHIESGLQVQADAGLLRVALDNLLGNAWKFSALQAQAEISVGQTLDAAGQQVFFVRDNGVGFDMAYADKLFTPFQRLHAVSEFAGTGIGLATVKRVIDRHGGRLWAESAPGHGATFFFTLPKWAAAV